MKRKFTFEETVVKEEVVREAPKQLDEQLNDYFWGKYRVRGIRDEDYRFYQFGRSISSVTSVITCTNVNHDTIVIRLFCGEGCARILLWDIMGHKKVAVEACKGIIEKYVADYYEYWEWYYKEGKGKVI